MSIFRTDSILLKPNDRELGEIFGAELTTPEQAAGYAEKLRGMGARNVLVSMAEKGAVLLDENGVLHKCGVCSGTVRNSVGAGDSMVAGFVAGYMKTRDYQVALNMGTAAGSATAFSDDLATGDLINSIYETL